MTTMTIDRQSVKAIDPSLLYAQADLYREFGIDSITLGQAVAAGLLRPTVCDDRVHRYDGESVQQWLSRSTGPGTTAHSPSTTPARTATPVASDGKLAINFRRAVAANIERGMSTRNATKKTVKEFPALHRAYLRNANTDRPNATGHLQG